MSFQGYVIAIQSDGSRLTYERWVYEYWVRGYLTDLYLKEGLESAVTFRVG